MHPDEPLDLDLRGLKCPMPVLCTRKALRRLPVGGRMIIRCTDPLAGVDIPHCLREDGHVLAHHAVDDGVATFCVVKGGTVTAADRAVTRPARLRAGDRPMS